MMTIYALVDPRDNLIHYVGKTNKAGRRLIEHRNEHGRVNPQKSQWLDDLKRHNLEPVMRVLETCEDADGAARELYWIKLGREQGWPLVNKAHGYETTQAKIDKVMQVAVHLGVIGQYALTFPTHTKRELLPTIANMATRHLDRSYEAAEAARRQAEKLEDLLEKIGEAAREIEPVTAEQEFRHGTK